MFSRCLGSGCSGLFRSSYRTYTKMIGAQITTPKEPLFVGEIDMPIRESDEEVIVKVTSAGVCHSDIHIWEGGYELGNGEFLSLEDRGIEFPLIPGHEIVGEVFEISEDADFEVGAEVVVYPWIGCGECVYCVDLRSENLCENLRSLGIFVDGGFAQYVKVPHYRHLADISGLDHDAASSLACGGLTPFSAVKKTLVGREPSKLAIIGAGGLGLCGVQIASALTENTEIVCIDIDDERLKKAKDLGADIVVNSTKEDPNKVIGMTVDACIDFVNSPDTSALGLSMLRKNGKLVLVGFFGGSVSIPLVTLPLKNLTIQGTYTGNYEDMVQMIELARQGVIEPLVTRKYGIWEADQALSDLRESKIVGRAVINPND